MSQERFTTSREVYHRIRWDPRLDAREFVIGYDAHGEALEEMPFEAFVPDGEIPWHRVWSFKRGRQVVWDRKQRIDLLDSLTPAPASPEPVSVPAPAPVPAAPAPATGVTALPAYRYDASRGAWVETPGTGPCPSPERLTVATFNVLFDLYDAELLATERRIPAVLAVLQETDADVIALQEVTGPFLRALLAEPWVREGYWVSEGPDGATVKPYGQVLLSRFPFSSLWQRAFSRDKRIIAGRLGFEGGAVWVATPHLMSNRDPSGGAMRATQAQALIDWARSVEDGEVIIAGDFNFGDGEPEAKAFAEAGFVDVWPALRPSESGETYDPTLNALAAVTTTSGLKRRLDRVLVFSPSSRLVPETVALFGEAPLKGVTAPAGGPLFPSDHFGVHCVLHRERPAARTRGTVSLVHQTAVVLIPPEEVWEPIQALRRKHDSKFQRWMPHVTLLYPFLPESLFDEAEALIADALADVKPFEVTLSGFGHFKHRANATAWLRPDDQPAGALRALHAALERALPECDEQGRKSSHGFTPHLSVGQLPRSDVSAITAWERAWRPLTFEVREVCIIRRKGDTPFEVVRRIPLGSRVRTPEASAAGESSARKSGSPAPVSSALQGVLTGHGASEVREARTAAVEQLRTLCARLGTELHPYGSYLLGTDGPGSDVDAVAIGPAELSREDFARALVQAAPPGARFVADAAIPMVKLALGGVSFDLSYASRPEGVAPCPPATLLAQHGDRLDAAGLRSILGLADTQRLLDVVTREGAGPERFQEVLRAVKAWAKARGIYSHATGYLGGLSWAVLVAWACTRVPATEAGSSEALLARFFETFATWPWPQPVTLTPETARYRPDGKRDILPVIAPAAPPRNTARNVSRSTFRVLRDEFARARDLMSRGATDALFEPVDLPSETPVRLELSIDAPTAEAREAAAGWVLGHLTALVYRLEGDRRLFTRPLPPSSPSGPFLIGLDAKAREALSESALSQTLEEFRASFREWSHRPEGASLRLERIHG